MCFRCVDSSDGSGLGGLIYLFFYFSGRWVGTVCRAFVGSEASFLTCVRVSEHISQNVQKPFKTEKFFFTATLKKNFLSSTCTARPLIYVDVSLHSNKKEKSSGACVSVECRCRFQSSRTPSLRWAANQEPAWEVLLCARRRVALKHLHLLAVMCGPICFLATQTLHVITCGPPQIDELRQERFDDRGGVRTQ